MHFACVCVSEEECFLFAFTQAHVHIHKKQSAGGCEGVSPFTYIQLVTVVIKAVLEAGIYQESGRG